MLNIKTDTDNYCINTSHILYIHSYDTPNYHIKIRLTNEEEINLTFYDINKRNNVFNKIISMV